MGDCDFPWRAYVEIARRLPSGGVLRIAAVTCFHCHREHATQCVVIDL